MMLAALRSMLVLVSLLVMLFVAFVVTMSLPGGQTHAHGYVVCRSVYTGGVYRRVCT
jgi:hypothetical protein